MVAVIVHRREHHKQLTEEWPADLMKDGYTMRLTCGTKVVNSASVKKRRKRKKSGLSRPFHMHMNLLSSAFLSSMRIRLEEHRSHLQSGRAIMNRRKFSSVVLWCTIAVSLGFAGRCWYRMRALQQMLDPHSGFHPHWHPSNRHERFPSVQERVQLYMSNWYLPPCKATDIINERVRFNYHRNGPTLTVDVNVSHNAESFDVYNLNSDIRPDTPLILRRDMVETCTLSDRWFNIYQRLERASGRVFRRTDHFVDHDGMRAYCDDAVEMLVFARNASSPEQRQLRSYSETSSDALGVPIIAQFGDEPTSHLQHMKVPYFKKFRTATTAPELTRVTIPPEARQTGILSVSCTPERPRLFSKGDVPVYAPILWSLRKTRHFGKLSQIPAMDTPWEKKQNKAVWRGTLTGIRAISKENSEYANCMKMLRCRMAFQYHNSSSVDVGLARKWRDFPATIHGKPIVKGYLHQREQLRFKAVIILEGNDVATGLKWALLSRSVVMMPRPTVTSWAMEEILEPWVHYIPLDADGSNVEERIKWMIDHDDKARKIAERATLFMYDLVFHPDAESDDLEIKSEIMRRYHEFFVHS